MPASVPLPAPVPPADGPPAHDPASIVGAHRAVQDVRAPTDEDEPEPVAAEPARTNRSRRGVLIGIAAAVAIALLLGGTLWLAVPGDDEGESGTAQPGSSVAAAPATPSRRCATDERGHRRLPRHHDPAGGARPTGGLDAITYRRLERRRLSDGRDRPDDGQRGGQPPATPQPARPQRRLSRPPS